jgi:hypothetical protein
MRRFIAISAPTIAGLTKNGLNPIYSKDVFNMFVPKFKEYVDGDNGKIETLKTSFKEIDSSETFYGKKLLFNKSFDPVDKTVLNVTHDGDIILGKKTDTVYREGYDLTSNVIIQNPTSSAVSFELFYVIDDVIIYEKSAIVDMNDSISLLIEMNLSSGSKRNSVVNIYLKSDVSLNIDSFENKVISKFTAPYGNGSMIYEAFVDIADNKILQKIWNVDWEFAMSLCVAHYLTLFTRESESSFGLGDIAKDSEPKGIKSTTEDKVKYNYGDIMLTHNETKFWNNTEYGRQLITLLSTKAVLTMIVVN